MSLPLPDEYCDEFDTTGGGMPIFYEIKNKNLEVTLTLGILAIVLVVLLVILLPSLRVSIVRSSASRSTSSV